MASLALDSQPHPKTGRDADAFLGSLYSEHSANVRAHVGRILSDPHLAEDVVQETMLRAWRKSDTLSPENGSVGGWLFRVAHRIAIDRLRARRARPAEVDEAQVDAVVWSVTDHADRTVDSVYVAGVVRTLSPGHR